MSTESAATSELAALIDRLQAAIAQLESLRHPPLADGAEANS
jgi:hypothetical protein